MYLKRLELHGFKSFAPRTILEYSPGVTAIVGPNGSGKCLEGSSLVTLADGRDVPIAQLVNVTLKNASYVESLTDGALTRDNPFSIRVLSLNPATLRLETHSVAAFVRRETPDYLVRVQTHTGRQIVTTPYHPFFTLEQGRLRTLKAEELKVGVRLALPRPVAMGDSIAAYALAEGCEGFRDKNRLYFPRSGEAQSELSPRLAMHVEGETSERTQIHLDRMKELATSDVYWDKIVGLEQVTPGEPWVYDLCIATLHNFVAENIIVHNSNVADGIRWVLGEQSMRQLRGKRSDDVIFAGGQGRPAAQMAEVGLVLDNSSAWLPSEFSEVTVTRRSFRSGDSEYLINGQRVRLKDVLLLLAQARIGHDSYTVIGQGLVDQALSLRAEERRGLFEDAAGTRQFQVQRNDAEQKLNLTQGNLGRLYDIIGEIEPRLAPLAEQARRAEDWRMARDELSRLLRTWYRRQWLVLQSARQEAEATERSLALGNEKLQDALAVEDGLIQELREQRESSVVTSAAMRRERDVAMNRLRTIERELAVAQERMTSLDQQQIDLTSEQEQQQEAIDAANAHVGALEAQVERGEAQYQSSNGAMESLERLLHTAHQEQELQEARLRAAQRDSIQIQARLGAAQAELGQLQRQLSERNRVLAARNETVAQALRKVETTGHQLEERQQLFAQARQSVEVLVAEREDLAREMNDGQSAIEEARATQADAQRERHATTDRLALLEEWKSSLDGADDGARALLNTTSIDHPPIRGILRELISTSEDFELAIEVACGSLLHALVVRTRSEARKGAEWLRHNHAGRAHFLWADAKVPVYSELAEKNEPPTDTVETFGFARDLVVCEADLRGLIIRVLGTIYVVRDLAVADRFWHDTSLPFPVVTLEGDLIHPKGWLRAGGTQYSTSSIAGTKDGGSILARERELRQLPAQIQQLDNAITELSVRAKRVVTVQEERKQKAEGLGKELVRTEELAQELARSVTAMQREQERAQSELQVNTTVAEQLLAEIRGIEQEVAAINTRVLEQEEAQLEANEQVDDIQAEVDEILASGRRQQEALAIARTTVVLHQQEVRALHQRVEQLRAQAIELEVQRSRRHQRVEALGLQRAELLETATAQESLLAELSDLTRDLGEQLNTHDVRQGDLERQIHELERGQNSERQELARMEVEYRRAIVESERAREAILTLAQQMREEFESENEEDPLDTILGRQIDVEGKERDNAVPVAVEASQATEIEDEPALSPEEATRLRRQIDQLRNRIKHLGGYDPEAPHAYEELKTRYDFMRTQINDLELASQNLRSVITELDITMRRQFEETFRAVNERFQRHFIMLFSGGAAWLELTAPKRGPNEDEDLEMLDGPHHASKPTGSGGGIEVFVQIPGKKVQDLALLSGGERALVSAALLFALLETNPPPFCLLDEVDAALDEANVMRFCDILEHLAEQTQFIIITHNRVTMTHADAIYGISMGGDSVSRVLSMRLADVKQGEIMGSGG